MCRQGNAPGSERQPFPATSNPPAANHKARERYGVPPSGGRRLRQPPRSRLAHRSPPPKKHHRPGWAATFPNRIAPKAPPLSRTPKVLRPPARGWREAQAQPRVAFNKFPSPEVGCSQPVPVSKFCMPTSSPISETGGDLREPTQGLASSCNPHVRVILVPLTPCGHFMNY